MFQKLISTCAPICGKLFYSRFQNNKTPFGMLLSPQQLHYEQKDDDDRYSIIFTYTYTLRTSRKKNNTKNMGTYCSQKQRRFGKKS